MSKQSAIELYVPLRIPAVSARDAAIRILTAIGKREKPYDRTMLALGLRDLHLPMEGTISVPIVANVEPRPLRWECHIVIEAEQNQQIFPKFDGTLTVTPSGHDACELWLQGNYEPPMGGAGAALDASVLRGAAENSLRSFLEWLGGEVERSVDEAEREHLRAMRQMRP